MSDGDRKKKGEKGSVYWDSPGNRSVCNDFVVWIGLDIEALVICTAAMACGSKTDCRSEARLLMGNRHIPLVVRVDGLGKGCSAV